MVTDLSRWVVASSRVASTVAMLRCGQRELLGTPSAGYGDERLSGRGGNRTWGLTGPIAGAAEGRERLVDDVGPASLEARHTARSATECRSWRSVLIVSSTDALGRADGFLSVHPVAAHHGWGIVTVGSSVCAMSIPAHDGRRAKASARRTPRWRRRVSDAHQPRSNSSNWLWLSSTALHDSQSTCAIRS